MKKIFIGGSGRSGTTIFLHALYKHPDLYAIPIETKFIVEVDGLADLVDFLTTRFSVTASREAKMRFGYLMKQVVTGLGENPYHAAYGQQDYRINELIENYEQAVDIFLSEITQVEYRNNREPLLSKARVFIDSLFTNKANSTGAIGWVEKTPSNIARIEFLNELFPDHYFIHMMRDPRGVLYSLMRLGWCDSDIKKATQTVKQRLQFIIEKQKIIKTNNYSCLEIKLEDLTAKTYEVIEEVENYLQIDAYPENLKQYLDEKLKQSSIQVNTKKMTTRDAWESGFDKNEIAHINKELEYEIHKLGYNI